MVDFSNKIAILKDMFGSFHRESEFQYLFQCPNTECNHHKRKLSINIDKGCYKCWICEIAGNLNFLVKKYGNRDQISRWAEITGEIDLSNNKISLLSKLNGEEKKKENQTIKLPEEYRSLTIHSLSSQKPYNYLKNRGITDLDIFNWKIGYTITGSYAGRIIIPSFNESGNIDYFIARSYDDNYIKYLNPKLEHDIVFNELNIDWDDDIVLVEGVFDAIVAGNAIPLLTSTLNENSSLFNKIVERKEKIYVALDIDAKKKESRIIKSFFKYGVEVFKITVEPYKDVGEMNKDEFRKRKFEAVKVNMMNLLKMKL